MSHRVSFSRIAIASLALTLAARGQILDLPIRPADAPSTVEYTNLISPLSLTERENWIYAQVVSGNVPNWWRQLKPITVTAGGHSITYHVTPDYLAIGSDTDYFLEPVTPILAQRLADRLGCTLPTRKMVNQIWTNAVVKLTPQAIPPSAAMITVPVFATNNFLVRTQRNASTNAHPLGSLVSGDKKDIVISTLIHSNLSGNVPKPVVIYGWHYPDGTPIQPLYNGHEETYADYSHGARFVRMQATVDGLPNTITNVLASPALAGLLSDETIAPFFTIPLPRYPVNPLAPLVMTPPRSRTVLPGESVSLAALAIGDQPLGCQWLFNGGILAGATNTQLILNQVQASQAGNYAAVFMNPSGTVASRVAVLRVRTSDFPELFADRFETSTATGWNLFWGAADGVPDYTAEFAFDYGAAPYQFNGVTALIPSAPNSPDGSHRGVKLAVNLDAVGALAAVNLYPNNISVTGNFALKFDLWINYPGTAGGANSTGSTQHALFGLNHLGTQANWSGASISDGVWFAMDGEGGTAADYRAYLGSLSGGPSDLTGNPAASGLTATNNTAAIFATMFPAGRFETPGAPGKNWVEVELRHKDSVLTWLLDGTLVAQRTNASAFTNGHIMLGLMDAFSSVASPPRDSFVIFDNVRVENLTPPIRFEAIDVPAAGTVALKLASAFGDSFVIETSTNLTDWLPVGVAMMTNNAVTFPAVVAPGTAAGFYRARR